MTQSMRVVVKNRVIQAIFLWGVFFLSTTSFAMTEIFQLFRGAKLKMVGCESLMRSDLGRFSESQNALPTLQEFIKRMTANRTSQKTKIDLREDFLAMDNFTRSDEPSFSLSFSRLAEIKRFTQDPQTRARMWQLEGSQVQQALAAWTKDEDKIEREIAAQMAEQKWLWRLTHGRLLNIVGRNVFWDMNTEILQDWLTQIVAAPEKFAEKILIFSSRLVVPRAYDNRLLGYGSDLKSARQETIELWQKHFFIRDPALLREVQVMHVAFVDLEGKPIWLVFYASRPMSLHETSPSGPLRKARNVFLDAERDSALVPIPVPVEK